MIIKFATYLNNVQIELNQGGSIEALLGRLFLNHLLHFLVNRITQYNLYHGRTPQQRNPESTSFK